MYVVNHCKINVIRGVCVCMCVCVCVCVCVCGVKGRVLDLTILLHAIFYSPTQQTNLNSNSSSESHSKVSGSPKSDSKTPLIKNPTKSTSFSTDVCHEPTIPHGVCRDKSSEEAEKSGGILHPRGSSCECGDVKEISSDDTNNNMMVKVGIPC